MLRFRPSESALTVIRGHISGQVNDVEEFLRGQMIKRISGRSTSKS